MNKIKIQNLILPKEKNEKTGEEEYIYFLRRNYNEEKVEQYKDMYKAGESKPIIIHRGTNILVDGFHRLEAFKRAEKEIKKDKRSGYLDCEYLDCQKEEIREKAIEINTAHGIPLTKEERNKQIVILSIEDKKPQKDIGKLFKISRNRVSEILKSSGVSETDTYKDDVLNSYINEEDIKQVEIAEKIDCSEATVSQVIKDFKNQLKELYLTLSFPEKIIEVLKKDKIEITEERLLELLEQLFDRSEYINKQIIHSDFLETNITNINLIVTDPPYNISGYGGSHKISGKIATFDAGQWDRSEKKEFIDKIFKQWLIKIKDMLVNGGSFYIFVDRYLISYIWDLCKEIPELKPKNIITWVKNNPVPNARNNYNSATEFILFGVKEGEKYTFNNMGWDYMNNVFNMPICSGNERTEHPTQKPVKLLQNFINISSKEEDIVLDCFAGSGSTGEACLQLKRRFIMIEKEKKYIDIIENRLK